MPANKSFDTDAQARPLPSVAAGVCAGQVRRYTAKARTIPHSCIVTESHAIPDHRKETHK